MFSERNRGRSKAWAWTGGFVLAAGAVAIIIAAIVSHGGGPPRATEPIPSTQSAVPTPRGTAVDVVDATASDRGWIPEPITTDPAEYAAAALQAAATFDTTKSARDEWLAYLDTWFTLDTRYSSDADRATQLRAAQLELRQGVVLPELEWESLAAEDGRVVASTTGDVEISAVPEDSSGDMAIGTADVQLTFTRGDASGGDTSYEESVRVSVQILCGDGSIPTPTTAQRAGDCKVVRFFMQPVEP